MTDANETNERSDEPEDAQPIPGPVAKDPEGPNDPIEGPVAKNPEGPNEPIDGPVANKPDAREDPNS